MDPAPSPPPPFSRTAHTRDAPGFVKTHFRRTVFAHCAHLRRARVRENAAPQHGFRELRTHRSPRVRGNAAPQHGFRELRTHRSPRVRENALPPHGFRALRTPRDAPGFVKTHFRRTVFAHCAHLRRARVRENALPPHGFRELRTHRSPQVRENAVPQHGFRELRTHRSPRVRGNAAPQHSFRELTVRGGLAGRRGGRGKGGTRGLVITWGQG